MGFGYQLDPGYVIAHAPELLFGLVWTVALTCIGVAGGILFGIGGGILRVYRVPIASPLVAAIVEFIRTTPLFVQIYFLYFGLPELGIQMPAFTVGALALVVWGGAYNTENFRAAIEGVPGHFCEAARSLGLRPTAAFRLVTLPIAARFAMPSVTNTAIETLKGSSLMLAISFPELTDTTMNLISVSFRVFELFFVLGAAYLVVSAGLSRLMRAAEHALAWPG
jgi:His/Glu/Gln/Arg/opine family amino acid ABC transporter permease subunit